MVSKLVISTLVKILEQSETLMEDEIIMTGPGFTIARTYKAHTAVPYPPVERPNGDQNFGFFDLRDKPELAASIPETHGSPGMKEILRAANAPGFRLMSLGCAYILHENDDPKPDDSIYLYRGYIQLAFRNSTLNASIERFSALAQNILYHIPASDIHNVSFEFIIEPLKMFFGDADRFCLLVKPLGYGDSEPTARSAWEYATQSIARAIESLPPLARTQ